MSLYQDWIEAKDRETLAIDKRRAIEDALVKELAFEVSTEGTAKYDRDGYAIKIVGRIDRKVDAAKLQEVAAENGLSDHLSTLFRWKPEVNMSIWKATDSSITEPLREAIVAKNGRPSFLIFKKED